MKKIVLTGVIVLTTFLGKGQTTLTLDTCYSLARQQYPLIKQQGLIEKSKEYSVSNAVRGYLPQFSINGQATYQSAVTAISVSGLPKPFNDISFPTPTKDQYNIHGEVDQVIYDGGVIKSQKAIDVSQADIQQQNLEVQLFALKDRINEVFFGALLLDEQIKQNDLTQKDIQSSIERVHAGVTNGTALQSDEDELQAELLQEQQNKVQLQSNRKAYLDMLGLLIGKTLEENTVLQQPVSVALSDNIKRPEIAYYESQKKSYDAQDEIISSGNMPRLSLFFQGGYAKPGLNAFDVDFEPYYIGGVRLSWNFGNLYTTKNSRQINVLNRQTADVQKETFLFNTKITLKQQSADIMRLEQMLLLDKDIITKRRAVTEASKAKLDNGTFTVHDYINELNAEDLAKQALLLHQVQLLMTQYEYQNTSGN